MIEVGTVIVVKTTTIGNTFGECVFEVVATGLELLDPSGAGMNIADGVKCVMLGGAGKSARKGFAVYDRASTIMGDIESGRTRIIGSGAEVARNFENACARANSGCHEI
jgi:hypothetical protein